MEIQEATSEDVEKLLEISKEQDFETKRDWKELVEKHEVFLLVDEKIIGFTGLIRHDWNRTLQISNIFILPEYRRKGLAQKLLSYLLEKAKKTEYRCVIAEAPSDNSVVRLYEKMGFRKCGYNDRYYNNTGAPKAFWMSYDLD